MRVRWILNLVALLFCGLLFSPVRSWPADRVRPNVIIFVADGLRHGSVNEKDTPNLWRIRQEGVYFANSHSLFPTFTTANASAIATGHYLGDTGDFSNSLWVGYPVFRSGNFQRKEGQTVIPFLEDDQVLGDLNDTYGGNYLQKPTLAKLARAAGYRTAVVGKLGPAAIQNIDEFQPHDGRFTVPAGVVIDDSTGRPAGLPLPPEIAAALQKAGLPLMAPDRSNGCAASDPCNNGNSRPGTKKANVQQQQFFVDAVTRAILPTFAAGKEPFFLVFWSRDPDGTQHNHGDEPNSLTPGINGPTSLSAIRNADHDLGEILDYLRRHRLADNTDVFVTSDHGFATISKGIIDVQGSQFKMTASSALQGGELPNGFLAVDIARHLEMSLFDPDSYEPSGAPRRIDLTAGSPDHPAKGHGLIGSRGCGAFDDGSEAKVVVAANGGSDLIYVPHRDPALVAKLVSFLTSRDYIGGIFVEDSYGRLPGTLPLSAIGLWGDTPLPRPTIVVAFRVFYCVPGNLQSAVQIADTALAQGQGNHAGFGRDSTFNNMAALGPHFRVRFVDTAPVSNADIVPTLAAIMGVDWPEEGPLRGRVLREALKAGTPDLKRQRCVAVSDEAAGYRTVLDYQILEGRHYFDSARFELNPVAHSGCERAD